MEVKTLIEDLMKLLDLYESTRRSHLSRDTYLWTKKWNPDTKVSDRHVRESLLEHVWTLPVIATYLHPLIDSTIDIWHVLKLLSVHDIWEIIAWEVITFDTNATTDTNELTAATLLLPAYQLERYKEFLEHETLESKFAHSVDRFCATINTLRSNIEAEKERWKINSITIQKVRNKHDPKQKRNKTTWEIHEECMHQFEELWLDSYS